MDHRDAENEPVGRPQPEPATRDSHTAQIGEPVHAASETNRDEAARERATTPHAISEQTVAEIAAEAEARARR